MESDADCLAYGNHSFLLKFSARVFNESARTTPSSAQRGIIRISSSSSKTSPIRNEKIRGENATFYITDPSSLYRQHFTRFCNTSKFTFPETSWNEKNILCVEWQFLQSNYFRFCYIRRDLYYTRRHPAMPGHAEKACQSMFGATLASLKDLETTYALGSTVRKCYIKKCLVSVGIKRVTPVSRRLRHLYRFLWQWGGQGGPIAYEESLLLQTKEASSSKCALFDPWRLRFVPVSCSYYNHRRPNRPVGFICMKSNTQPTKAVSAGITFPRASTRPVKFPTKECFDGSLVHTFLCCRWEDFELDNTGCSPNSLPFFQCYFGQSVHYSLVCDGNEDCADRSDETGCRPPQFAPLLKFSFICKQFQVIPERYRCDGRPDCFDDSDEEACVSCKGERILCSGFGCVPQCYTQYFKTCPVVPCISQQLYLGPGISFNAKELILDGVGMVHDRVQNKTCSEGFYPCQNGNCIPTYLFNNGEKDCLLGEDEGIPIHNMTCPDYYRCRVSGSCVHSNYVCDGVHHCPYKDDEIFCHWSCPLAQGCSCEGQAYVCSKMIDPLQNLHVRYLDVSHATNVSLENVHFMEYLFFFNLSFCHLGDMSFRKMLHLQTLDLSFNSLTRISSQNFDRLPKLQHLTLDHNPLEQTFSSAFSFVLNGGALYDLKVLFLTNVNLKVIGSKVFSSLSKLRYLDIRKNPVHSLDKDSLFGLTALEELYTDDSRLCCGFFHDSLPKCYAPINELSSCSDLLAQDFFRVFLWILSTLTILGNTGVLIYRQFVKKCNVVSPSLILVKNLCTADLLMGIYMVMVGVADAAFTGVYVAKENEWKNSTACIVAGFLSFVSSEVSALVVCLITIDRVLAICFPFSSHVHFNPTVTRYLCLTVWILGLLLASAPLLVGLEFYGQNAICIPLPITRRQFSGQVYAFCVFIVLNFVLFILIGLGQLFIYRAVRKASTAAGTERREQDLTIARRLFQVAFTDFCCWFPIGLMGLLAARGTSIPERVNVWSAIFVLPLNSALNPFLYTLNGVMEQVRKQRTEKKMKKILGTLQTEIQTWQPANVQELTRICIHSKLVSVEAVKKILAKVKGGGGDDVDDQASAYVMNKST